MKEEEEGRGLRRCMSPENTLVDESEEEEEDEDGEEDEGRGRRETGEEEMSTVFVELETWASQCDVED